MLKLKLQYLATWCKEMTHWKKPWCWERLKAGGEGWHRMTWLDSITDLMDMNLSKLQQIMEDWGAWCAAVRGVTNSWPRLRDWTTVTAKLKRFIGRRLCFHISIAICKRCQGDKKIRWRDLANTFLSLFSIFLFLVIVFLLLLIYLQYLRLCICKWQLEEIFTYNNTSQEKLSKV